MKLQNMILKIFQRKELCARLPKASVELVGGGGGENRLYATAIGK